MEITEAHAREYLRRAVAAREDPAAFIEFVMRSELPPHERIRLAPHQLVILAFLMHPPHVARAFGATKVHARSIPPKNARTFAPNHSQNTPLPLGYPKSTRATVSRLWTRPVTSGFQKERDYAK